MALHFTRFQLILLVAMVCKFGTRCEVHFGDDDETVGMGGLPSLRAAAVRAHLLHDLELHRIRAHRPHHLLLAPNPSEKLPLHPVYFTTTEQSVASTFPVDLKNETSSNNEEKKAKVKSIDLRKLTPHRNDTSTTSTVTRDFDLHNKTTSKGTLDEFGDRNLVSTIKPDVQKQHISKTPVSPPTDFSNATTLHQGKEKLNDDVGNKNTESKNHVKNDFSLNSRTNAKVNENMVERIHHSPRNKHDEELFLQYLNTVQSENNREIIRTANSDVKSFNDQIYDDQNNFHGGRNFPRVTFYPVLWKNGSSESSTVQKFDLTPIMYVTSGEEVHDEAMEGKFRRLGEKMRMFQSGDYNDEGSGARSANPGPHLHSHSFEIHHTKYVRPSNFHHERPSLTKHKQFSSNFESSGHTSHFSFDKKHWKDTPAYGQSETHVPLPVFETSGQSSFDNKHPIDASGKVFDSSGHSSFESKHPGFGHSKVVTPSSSHVTINNQNNFLSTDNHNIQIAQGNGGSISQSQVSSSVQQHGEQLFDRSSQMVTSPFIINVPSNRNLLRYKRSFSLIKLITDPRVQLDVPKTLENVGTVARNSFEDEQAPMYHVRNMMGSARNVVLSTLKIPPQNALIPTQYKIVDKKMKYPEGIDPNLLRKTFGPTMTTGKSNDLLKETNDDLSGTFQRVGNIVRESVRSGQETFQHVGDVVHNAKKALAASRHSAPRLLLPYARTPVIKKNKPNKIMLITPRFADVTQRDQILGEPPGDDFVGLGEIMDAVGVSNPEKKNVGLTRLVLQPILGRKSSFKKSPVLESRFGADDSKSLFILKDHIEENEIDDVSNTLESMKNVIGAKTLKDFLMYMKQNFLLEHLKEKLQRKNEIVQLDQTLNENVGRGLGLGNDLLTPFMGRPSKTDLSDYFRKNGDSVEDFDTNDEIFRSSVSAINPQVFEDYFNETLKINDTMKSTTDQALSELNTLEADDQKVRSEDLESTGDFLRLNLPKNLKKPFLGKKFHKIPKYFY